MGEQVPCHLPYDSDIGGQCPALVAALLLDPEEYAGAGERLMNSAKEAGIWGRLGPSVTKANFQKKPEVCYACCVGNSGTVVQTEV